MQPLEQDLKVRAQFYPKAKNAKKRFWKWKDSLNHDEHILKMKIVIGKDVCAILVQIQVA